MVTLMVIVAVLGGRHVYFMVARMSQGVDFIMPIFAAYGVTHK